jgi:hypothetical protein
MAETPGRSCPVGYRYGPDALRAAPTLEAETLYVAGGLYGNPFALDTLLGLVRSDPGAKVVFNGDFNWFDVDPGDFRKINETVLSHAATRGNVETELASPAKDAGCGCGYPDWVGNAEVERSNRILERLRTTALGDPELTARLGALPMFVVASVGGLRTGIVHGDAHSLAGWGFSQETLSTREGMTSAAAAFEAAGLSLVASSHTCLPVMQRIEAASGEAVLVNNGAAGMPNFRGTRHGLVTRISVRPRPGQALYATTCKGVHVEAVPVLYDADAWKRRFLEHWPAGSDAYLSYFGRICEGPAYAVGDALRASSAVHQAAAALAE